MSITEDGRSFSHRVPVEAQPGEAKPVEITPLFNPHVRQQLERFGVPEKNIDTLYSKDGHFHYRTPDDLDFRNMSLVSTRAALEERTRPIYGPIYEEDVDGTQKRIEIVDRRLMEEKPENGFNRHNLDDHVSNVADMTDDLLKVFGQGDRVRMLGIQVAYGHDLGNINSRRNHSVDSTVIYPFVVPSLLRNEEDWGIVEAAIRNHDERYITNAFRGLGLETSEQRMYRVLEMGEQYGDELVPVLAATILADKADMDRNRINEAAINLEAVKNDPHVLVNLCARSERFSFDPNTRELTLRVGFDTRVLPHEEEKFAAVSRPRSHHQGMRINYPEQMKVFHRQHDIPLFYQWAGKNKAIYGERYRLMGEMASLLGARKFWVDFVDLMPKADGGVGEHEILREPYDPASLNEHFELSAMKSGNKEERLKNFASYYQKNGK